MERSTKSGFCLREHDMFGETRVKIKVSVRKAFNSTHSESVPCPPGMLPQPGRGGRYPSSTCSLCCPQAECLVVQTLGCELLICFLPACSSFSADTPQMPKYNAGDRAQVTELDLGSSLRSGDSQLCSGASQVTDPLSASASSAHCFRLLSGIV